MTSSNQSCVVSKNIEKGKLILNSNKILINGNPITKDSLKPLLIQNKNKYFLGFPFSASLYESSKKNTDSIFDKWLKKSSNKEKKNPISLINPVITKLSTQTTVYEEGCLSIPDTFLEIERPKICEVEYIDILGKVKILKCDGLLSTCIQHEINHLDGKLIIDHLSKLKRDLIVKKISKSKTKLDRVVV